MLAVLGALLAYAVPNVLLKDNTALPKPNTTNTASNKDNKLTTSNTANASENKKDVNKNKLEIDNLINKSYALKTANTETNPFKSITSAKDKAKTHNTQPNTTTNNNLNTPSSIPMNIDRVDNNVMAIPNSGMSAGMPEKETAMTLRAIAQTNNKIIAVIEADGKRTSAFIGTNIGEYTVTDIDNEHVYLQNDMGYSRILDLSK